MPSQVTTGGTGAPTAAGARINLGLGPNSAVSFASLTLSGNLNVSGTATFGAASFTSFTVPDSGLSITGSSDATKILKFEVDGFTTGTTRTVTIPNASTTMVGTDVSQTLTNKTINSSAFNGTIGATTPSTGAFQTVSISANTNPLLTLTRTSNNNVVIAFTKTAGTVYAGHGADNTFAISNSNDLSSSPWFSINSTTATFSTALTTTGAFTSIGIDDNATGERLQLADTILTLGTTGEIYNIVKPANDAGIILSGGTAFNTGAAIILRGNSTGISQDNHIVMLSAGTTVYRYDPSITEHTFTGEMTVANGTTGRLSLGNGGAFLQYSGASNSYDLNNTSGSVLSIDSSGKITIPGGQITFPATQVPSADANTLDDYEEGTFTPTISGQTTAGTGTYSNQVGQYTKIGNIVFFNAVCTWSAHTGTGNIMLTNLPFTAAASITCACEYSSLTYTSIPFATVISGTTEARLRSAASGGGVAGIAMDTAATLRVSGFYHV